MDGRKLILLIGSLMVAAITAFLARSLLMGAPTPVAGAQFTPAPTQPMNTTEVLVATRALPVGTLLTPEMLKFQPWPKDLVENAYFRKDGKTDLKALQGTVVRVEIPAGQPVTQGALVKPGDRGFLAAALGPGMRAVTFPVSATSSVAGFIFPGDRVDLILTQTVEGGGDGPPLKTSETILRNLRVLATDQRTDKQTDDKGNTVVSTYSMMTVEATPKLAEKIAVAQTLGSLSLSLRSIADNTSELEQAIANGEVDVPDTDDPKAEKAMIASVADRPGEGRSTFSTGADVSRFQRRTVPAKAETPGAPGQTSLAGPVVRVFRGGSPELISFGRNN